MQDEGPDDDCTPFMKSLCPRLFRKRAKAKAAQPKAKAKAAQPKAKAKAAAADADKGAAMKKVKKLKVSPLTDKEAEYQKRSFAYQQKLCRKQGLLPPVAQPVKGASKKLKQNKRGAAKPVDFADREQP